MAGRTRRRTLWWPRHAGLRKMAGGRGGRRRERMREEKADD